jgi:hypothetical protein
MISSLKMMPGLKMRMIQGTDKGGRTKVKDTKQLFCVFHLVPLALIPIFQATEVLLSGSRQKKEKAVFPC